MMALFSRITNKILDTTPRQWFYHGVALVSDLSTYLVDQAFGLKKVFINLKKPSPLRLALGASLLFHVSVYAGINVARSLNLVEGFSLENSQGQETEFVFVEIEPSTRGLYVDQSPVIIKADPKDRKILDLLKKLKSGPRSGKVYGASKIGKSNYLNELGKSNGLSRSEVATTNLKRFKYSGSQTVSKQSEEPPIKTAELLQFISKHDPSFQRCYEKALVVDQMLAGQVSFEMDTNNSGRVALVKVNFSGKGSPNSQRQLKSCLRSVSQGIRLPNKVKTAKIKFNLLMI